MQNTYTQREAETEVLRALLAATGEQHTWESVSDAFDVRLGAVERVLSRQIDRNAIPRHIMLMVLDGIVSDTRARDTADDDGPRCDCGCDCGGDCGTCCGCSCGHRCGFRDFADDD